MTAIRPTLAPSLPPATPRAAEATRTTAQRAFFEIAAGRAAPAAAAPTVRTSPAASAAPARNLPAQPPLEAPAKPLRPGSILDIRV